MSNNNQGGDIKINIADEVKTNDHFGGENGTKAQDKGLTDAQRDAHYKRIIELSKLFVDKLIPGREVTNDDIERIKAVGKDMLELCYVGHGIYNHVDAMAHTQICNEDPLMFFITQNGEFIVNPKIVKHTEVPVYKKEGNLQFPDKTPKEIKRFNKIEVEFQTLQESGEGEDKKIVLTEPIVSAFSGNQAVLFQTMCMYLNGHHIHEEEEYDPFNVINKE